MTPQWNTISTWRQIKTHKYKVPRFPILYDCRISGSFRRKHVCQSEFSNRGIYIYIYHILFRKLAQGALNECIKYREVLCINHKSKLHDLCLPYIIPVSTKKISWKTTTVISKYFSPTFITEEWLGVFEGDMQKHVNDSQLLPAEDGDWHIFIGFSQRCFLIRWSTSRKLSI